jgi:aminoglycoside phosphotransferase (APT) family kinase protein
VDGEIHRRMIGHVKKEDLRGRGDQGPFDGGGLFRQAFFQKAGEGRTDRAEPAQVDRGDGAGERPVARVKVGQAVRGLGTKALVIDFSESTSFLPHVAAGGSLEGLPGRLAEALASFHAIPIEALPRQLERPTSWDAYLTTRIGEWRRTADAHVEDLPIMRFMAGWLDSHRPAPVPLTLMHGDFQSANLMLTADGHFEVLDWELASIGDPREDMGYFKAVAQIAPPDLLDDAGCEAFCARYRELTGMNELQLNPAVVAYFLILGVVGTVRRLLEGAADYARGTNRLMASVFNMNSVQFGQSVWLPTADALGPVMDQLAALARQAEGNLG